MKIIPDSLHRAALSTLVSVLVGVVAISVIPSSAVVGAAPPAKVGGQAAAAAVTAHVTSTESITTGPSRGECLTPDIAPGASGLDNLQSVVTSFDDLTGTTVNCLSAYIDTTQTWAQWEQPWVTSSEVGFSSWVAQEPQVRQLVLAFNMIPLSLQNVQNPTKWEQACAAGHYDSYATKLGENLVAAGLQNSVLRLGPEMNGQWEPDFIGTKVSQQKLWAKCFDNEISSMRRVKGEEFLSDWNPNACWGDYPYANYYPGNAYVNIIGIDLYDVGCEAPYTRLTFAQLANEQLGLTHFEAFAKAKGKAMSFPEWGLAKLPSGDDAAYIDGMGSAFKTLDFSFEAYFDSSAPNLGSLPLGPVTPLSVAAFQQWFGSSS